MTNEPKPNLKPWEVERDEKSKDNAEWNVVCNCDPSGFYYDSGTCWFHLREEDRYILAYEHGYNAAVERMLADVNEVKSAMGNVVRMFELGRLREANTEHPLVVVDDALRAFEQKWGGK